MDIDLEVKPSFTLPASSLHRCIEAWHMATDDYHKHIRYGQHICNWFALQRMEGDNKLFEQRLWQMNDPQLVTDMLLTVIDWSN